MTTATEETTVATGVVEQVTVLHGHTTPDTAYVVDDYPYGSLRCTIRYWLDTAVKGAKKGQTRFVSQTSNPKRHGPGKFGVAPDGHPWNTPHPGTYVDFAVMYLDAGNRPSGKQHVHWSGTGVWVNPASDARLHLSGAYDQLTADERKMYDVFVKVTRARDSSSWKHWNDALSFVAGYHTEHGTYPTTGQVAAAPGFYLASFDYPAAVAQVAAGTAR